MTADPWWTRTACRQLPDADAGAGYPHGFRGGRTPRQRVDIRRAQVRAGAA